MIIRSISLEKELNERLQNYCKETGRTVSGLICFLLIKYMEQEDGARRSTELSKEEG